MGRALDRVVELLAKRAADAPIGSVVVEMRRFVRLMGEGVLRVRRRARVVRRWGGVTWWVIWRRVGSCRVLWDSWYCNFLQVV